MSVFFFSFLLYLSLSLGLLESMGVGGLGGGALVSLNQIIRVVLMTVHNIRSCAEPAG